MGLEISVEDLLNKRKIESDRIEFKAGWNPDDIYHSVCAFANDYNNDGGGYIVVGVEEKNGVAVRPVKGISEYMLDEIQKEMLSYNNMISPPYFPKAIPLEVDGKWILVIVVRTGQQRPYKSPEHVTGKKDKKYNYYIRYLTSSVKANAEQERELINMSDQTPYDCRANHKATFDDISPVLLEDHLRKTGSRLAKQVKERGVEEILEDMQLLVGPPELRYIQNVAIMMFCELVTIEIEPDCINIMNFPGIDRSISEKTIAEGKRFVSRYYRNRRLGEFLKELDLSEGHSSGIPTIQEELEKNGSPRAEFFTDEDRRAMRIRIPIHPAFLEENKNVVENVIENVMDISEKRIRECIPSYSKKKAARAVEIVKMISDNPKVSIGEMRIELDVTDRTIARYISELKEHNIIDRIGPDNGGSWKILL